MRIRFLLAMLFLTNVSCAKDESAKGTRTEIPHDTALIRVLDNSETLSNIVALNNKGHVLGYREIGNEGVFRNEYFFDDGQQTRKIPELEGYTHTEATALSDNRLAVGYASKPVSSQGGGVTALVWDTQANELTKLAPYPEDLISQAFEISADGTVVSGYTTGAEPQRTRPCVWTFDAKVKSWECVLLPTLFDYNPSVVASRVVLSPDGSLAASCIAVEKDAGGFPRSILVYWKRDGSDWRREKLGPGGIRIHAISDEGLLVGEMTIEGARNKGPVVIDLEGKKTQIDLYEGDESGAAYDVNADGIVVGVSNDPHGKEGGPHAFMWKAGEVLPIDFPEQTVYSLANCINENGQIAGYADVELPGQEYEDSDTGEKEPLVKVLGFIWSPKKSSK